MGWLTRRCPRAAHGPEKDEPIYSPGVKPSHRIPPATVHRRVVLGSGLAGALALLAACAPATTAVTPSPSRTAPTDARSGLAALRAGNQRFAQARAEHPNQGIDRQREVTDGQDPFAIVLTCADSRLAPELVFDQGLGDLFTIRVAGNVVDSAVLGSIEYAALHLATPLVVVLGHEKCGAVAAAIDVSAGAATPEGEVASIVSRIMPAVEQARAEGAADLLESAVRINASHCAEQIATAPPLVDAVTSKALTVVPAYYSLDTARVTFI